MYNKLLITAGGGIISSEQQAKQENCATVAIGLGGTGISCLRTLKKEVFTRVKPDDSDASTTQYRHIKYLAVDSDSSSLEDTRSIDTLDTNTEFFNISCPDINGLLNQAHILAQDTSLKWLKTKNTQEDGGGISILSAEAGAGGVRQIGRLLLLRNVKAFVSKLTNIITEARKDLTGSPSLNIHIFTGIAGGTGAGIFLDVCYLVQYVLKRMGLAGQAYTCGYFFLPDVNMANHPTDYLPINGFASMKELDYCMNYDNNGGEWDQQYEGFSMKTSEPPVKLAHLITATDSGGHIVSNAYNYVMHVVVDYVLEYIIRPFVNEGEDKVSEGVFTIKSHIANVNSHVGLVDKKHGATYNYCILGASNAYLPYKEITTYLTSKIFEGFSNLPKQMPFDADIDLFLKNNNLGYNDIYRELNEKMPAVPNIPVDYKILYEQVEGISTDIIPAILAPMRDVGAKIAGQLQKNKEALLNLDSSGAARSNGSKLALVERIRTSLIDIAKQADKGPYYASGMLHNLNARDLQKTVVGYKAENDKSIQMAVGDFSLREKTLENTLNALKNSNVLNRKKKAKEYADAYHAYYVQRYKIDTLQKMGELLTEFEKQLSDLHNGYFSIFALIMRDLQATFEANRVALSNPLNDDIGYAVKLITIQDLQVSLDETVAAMDIPGQIHGFVADMLNNSESWILQDENKIFSQVNKYFLSQLSEYTGRTIDDYLKIKFGTTDPALLQKKVYEDIITPLGSKAAPMFWTENGIYSLADSASMGYLSIPNISDFIQAAARQYTNEHGDVAVRNAWATDRITIFRFVCGVPLFGYKGVTNYKEEYKHKKLIGSHLYEGSARDARDSRKLINVSPLSCIPKEMYTPDDIRNVELYDFALAHDIVKRVSIGDGFEHHLIIFDLEEISDCLSAMQEILDTGDVQKASVFIDNRAGKGFAVKFDRVIPITQNTDYADLIVKDHILGSTLLVQILSDQVLAVKQYSEKLNLLSDLVDSTKRTARNIHNFAMAAMTGNIKKINDYAFVYCYETYGIEESVELTTIDSTPYGMQLPLYSAYQGYCRQEDGIKEQIEKSIKDALMNKKERVDSCINEVMKWIASEKINALLSAARGIFPEKLPEISAFFRQFVGEVKNFAATR